MPGVARQRVTRQAADADGDHDRPHRDDEGVDEIIVKARDIQQLRDEPEQRRETERHPAIHPFAPPGQVWREEQQANEAEQGRQQEEGDQLRILRPRTQPDLFVILQRRREEEFRRARARVFQLLQRLQRRPEKGHNAIDGEEDEGAVDGDTSERALDAVHNRPSALRDLFFVG